MTAAWLEPVAAALDCAPTPRPVFFRDDDAGWDDEALSGLLGCFADHGVPVDVAVIPSLLTETLARDLRARGESQALRLHQHGYAHTNHEPEGRKCEFGAARGGADQAADVRRGRMRLLDSLWPLVDPVFTPPWNRCVRVTADVLVSEGLEVLSRDSTAEPFDRPDLAEIPVTVDWFGHRKGVRWTRDELARRLADAVGGDRPVGVMLHHAVTDDDEREVVAELLRLFATHAAARLTTIMELAAPVPSGLPGTDGRLG